MSRIGSRLQWLHDDFTRKTLHTYATRLGLMASDFVMGVLITRLLGPEGRGIVAVAGAGAGLFSQFGLLGLHNANTHYAARGRFAATVLVGNSLLVALIIGMVALLVVSAGLTWDPSAVSLEQTMLVLMLLAVPVQSLQSMIPSVLLGLQEVYAANRIELYVRGAQFLLLLGLLVMGAVTPETVFLVGVVVGLAGVVQGVRTATRQCGGGPRISLQVLRDMLGYGFKSYLAALLSFAVLRVDLLLISYLLGVHDAGQYAAAVSIITAIYVLPTTLAQLAFAKLSAMTSWPEKVGFANRVALTSGLVMLVLVLVLAPLADRLFVLIYGAAFAPSAQAFVWLLPGTLVWSVEGVLRKLYTSDGYATWVVMAWALAFLVNLVLNLMLIPVEGIAGAAMASSAALVVVGVWTGGVYLRDLYARRGKALRDGVDE